MEIDYNAICTEKELKLAQTFMNSKIDIFQEPEDYVFRPITVSQRFHESYEHQQIQKDTSNILSSSSSLLMYTIASGENNIYKTKKKLQNTFSMSNYKESNPKDIENQYNQIKMKIMHKKLENDPEFIQLDEFINKEKFHQLMMTNKNFAKFILFHKYIKFHPKHEELNQKYLKTLCPNFNLSNSDDTD
jgi:hypothetical protein